MHGKVFRLYTRPRLTRGPRLTSPWRGEFKTGIPLELFESISQDILQRTSFGQRYRETNTNTEIIFEITDLKKAKYLFGRMYLDRFEVDPADILKRRVSGWNNNVESCEVLASTDKPMEHTYNANLMCFASLPSNGQLYSSLPCTEFRPSP